MREARELTIREAGERMRAGALTAEGLVESCLERIRAREGVIHAWVERLQPPLDGLRVSGHVAPDALDANGLPFGMQLAGQPYAEERLLEAAAWCEKVLAFTASPIPSTDKEE